MSVIVMEVKTITALAGTAVRAEVEMCAAKILFAGCTCLGREYAADRAERVGKEVGFRFEKMAEGALFRVAEKENSGRGTIGVAEIASRFLGLK